MDDRWRFLYCDATELRGHTREARPGKEPGESGCPGGAKVPPERHAVRRPKESREE